jgi:hypothetical protein
MSETPMLAALWQGKLMAALGVVAEDMDFRSPVPETKRRRYHHSRYVMEGVAVFFKEFLEKVP